MALEPAPVYLPLVQQGQDQRWYMTPQWLQWFQSSQDISNSTSSTTALNGWKSDGTLVTLTGADQILATVSIVPATSGIITFITGMVNLVPATGSPATFEDCVFSLKVGTTVLEAVTQSVYGDENTVVSFQANDTGLKRNHTYAYHLTGRRLGTPTAISPKVTLSTLSIIGTNS